MPAPPPSLPQLRPRSCNRKAWLMRGAYVGVPLLVVICAGWLFVRWLTAPPPTAEELRNIFRTHRTEFDLLIQMMSEDRQVHKVYKSGWFNDLLIDPRLESKRLRQYRKILKRLHLESVERDSFGYTLTARAGGAFPDDGWYLGYQYFSAGQGPAPEERVQNFKMYGPNIPSGYQFVSLEPPWFLYYME